MISAHVAVPAEPSALLAISFDNRILRTWRYSEEFRDLVVEISYQANSGSKNSYSLWRGSYGLKEKKTSLTDEHQPARAMRANSWGKELIFIEVRTLENKT